MGWEITDPAPQIVTTVPAVATLRCWGPVRYKMMNGSMNVPARLTRVPTHSHQNGAGRPSTRPRTARRVRSAGPSRPAWPTVTVSTSATVSRRLAPRTLHVDELNHRAPTSREAISTRGIPGRNPRGGSGSAARLAACINSRAEWATCYVAHRPSLPREPFNHDHSHRSRAARRPAHPARTDDIARAAR